MIYSWVKEEELLVAKIVPTQLGKAAFASSIPAEFALQIFSELAESRNNLVLQTDLHLIYLILPHYKNVKCPDWSIFMSRYQKLSSAEQRIAGIYGLNTEEESI